MIGARPIAALIPTLAAVSLIACGPRRIADPSRPGGELIVLLPDSDGSTGRARVTNKSGSADLAAERNATHVSAKLQPGPVSTLSKADVRRIFGETLSALPPPPRHFTLYFRFESDELTDEARALVPEILKTVRERGVPDVTVIGHTDTMGVPAANFALGLKRAATVRKLLVQAGLDASFIEMTSHGESELLIRTPDETPEPGNRRVEIAVR